LRCAAPPERFADFLLAAKRTLAAARASRRDYRSGNSSPRARPPWPRAAQPAERAGLSGEQIGQELRRRRIAAIEALKTASSAT
jgi:hypothetical protein